MARLENESFRRHALKEKLAVGKTSMSGLTLIGKNQDRDWKLLLDTCKDVKHFHLAALAKVERDAEASLGYSKTRKSPSFQKPPDRVNETSLFPLKQDLTPYELLQEKIAKLESTDLDILLDNKLGTYLNNLLEKDPVKGVSKPTKEKAARWAEQGPKQKRFNKTLDYVEEQCCIEKIIGKV